MFLVISVKTVNFIIIIAIYKRNFVRMPLSLLLQFLLESLNKLLQSIKKKIGSDQITNLR